jgi:hypothetical protein
MILLFKTKMPVDGGLGAIPAPTGPRVSVPDSLGHAACDFRKRQVAEAIERSRLNNRYGPPTAKASQYSLQTSGTTDSGIAGPDAY